MIYLRRSSLVLVLLFAGLTTALGQDSVPAASAENTTRWLVELTGAPTADGGNAASIAKEKTDFRKTATAAGIVYKEQKAFDTLWNGLAITATRSDANKIAAMNGVKAVYPDIAIKADPSDPIVSQPDMAWAVKMTGADLAQNTLGLTGKGVTVAVIDTGIDYIHPDLGGCFGPGCRVTKGWDLVGDAFNADST